MKVILVAIATTVAGAAASETVHLPNPTGIATCSIAGTYRVKPRGHDAELSSRLGGRLTLRTGDLRTLVPAVATVGVPWTVDEKAANAIGRKIYKAVGHEHRPQDKAAWDKWLGTESQPRNTTVTCPLTAKLVGVSEEEGGLIARIALSGRLTADTTGACSGRFGPNFLNETWNLPLTGMMTLGMDDGAATVLLEASGACDGKYHNGGTMTHPYTFNVALSARVIRPTAEQRTAFAVLIEELAHNSFRVRQAATAKALALDPSEREALIAILDSSDDPELRHRAKLIAEGSPTSP